MDLKLAGCYLRFLSLFVFLKRERERDYGSAAPIDRFNCLVHILGRDLIYFHHLLLRTGFRKGGRASYVMRDPGVCGVGV